MTEYLRVGFIARPHGLKGAVKLDPLTDDVHRADHAVKGIDRSLARVQSFLNLTRNDFRFTCSNKASQFF